MKPSLERSSSAFPHERLDVWHVARQARVAALRFTETVPAGHGDELRQINKAAASVVRNVCEGANRWKPAEKIHKFEIAQGEAGEAAGAVVSLLDCGLGDAELAAEFLGLEARVGMMLTGLVRRLAGCSGRGG
jgi:four helix bundle protein